MDLWTSYGSPDPTSYKDLRMITRMAMEGNVTFTASKQLSGHYDHEFFLCCNWKEAVSRSRKEHINDYMVKYSKVLSGQYGLIVHNIELSV